MTRKVRFILTALIAGWLCGCSTTIVNLTPTTLERTSDGIYPFEAAWNSNESAVRSGTLEASVLIGMDTFPMQASEEIPNRYQALIPVPAGQNMVNYRYKFVYDIKGVPQDRTSSQLSDPFILRIIKEETRPVRVIPN